MLTGGGTGGHITPILALAHELKRSKPNIHIVYIGERGGKFAKMTADNKDFDEIHAVYAGKFRRYHGESWLKRLLDVKTNLLNLRDLVYFMMGTVESILLMRRIKADAVFLKGGFVGVPVGLAAAFCRVPFVTHDSDAVPGLANRLVARWATYHATALPAAHYKYPSQNVKHVGVLVSSDHRDVTATQQTAFKKNIGVPENSRLLLVTGGSTGAANINRAMKMIVEQLLSNHPDLYVIHQTGKGKAGVYNQFSHDRLRITELLFPLYEYTGASDVVVTRAGANTLAELGVQGKACIVVPNPLLTGGHQVKNARYFEEQGAIRIVKETTVKQNPESLMVVIDELLDDEVERQRLGKQLQRMTITDATRKLAVLLLEVATKE